MDVINSYRCMWRSQTGGPPPPPAEGDIPAANPLPSGALSFSVDIPAVDGAAGYVIFVSPTTQVADASLYPYRYPVSSAGVNVIPNVQSGTKFVRIAAHDGTWITELSPNETEHTPA